MRRCIIKYWLDEEFIDDGKTIGLVSIGIVSGDGREYYAQSCEFDVAKASDWVRYNVLSQLKTCHRSGKWNYDVSLYSWRQCGKPDCPWRTREEIRDEIIAFCDPEKYGKPEIIGWCSGFDFVAFCQLFGTMMDLPADYPHYFKELQNALDERGIPDSSLPPQQGDTHNALADAKYIKLVWETITETLPWMIWREHDHMA